MKSLKYNINYYAEKYRCMFSRYFKLKYITYQIKLRFFNNKTNIKLNIPKNSNFDVVVFHACFKLLCDFVETEKAIEYLRDKKPKNIKEKFKFYCIENWYAHNAEYGLQQLQYDSDNLLEYNSNDVYNYASVTRQLYIWYTEIRPKRIDDIRNLQNYNYDEQFDKKHLIDYIFNKNALTNVLSHDEINTLNDYTNVSHNIRMQNIFEDHHMLKLLLSLKSYLWT